MALQKPVRRLTLRELLTDAEKRSRDVVDNLNNVLIQKVADLRDLSRTVRKKSHYPTLMALHNSLDRVVELTNESEVLIAQLEQQLNEIRDHARRERFNRN